MALFLAKQVIEGKLDFADVPEPLQADVQEILVDAGFGDLCE